MKPTFLLIFATFAFALVVSPVESARGGLFALTKNREYYDADRFDAGNEDDALHTDVEKRSLGIAPARPRRRLLASVFGALLGAAQGANGIVGTVQSVLNLFGSHSAEVLVGQFRDRGYSHIMSHTKVHVIDGLYTQYYESYMTHLLYDVLKVDKTKFKQEADHMIRTGLYVHRNEWVAESAVFSTGKGGEATSFTIFYNRNYDCEVMNIVAVETTTKFELGKDIFVIAKMKATFGGAFSNTKLSFKEKDRGLTKEEVHFVTTYFAALALKKIKDDRKILDASGKRQTCSRRRLQARRLWTSYPASHPRGIFNDEMEFDVQSSFADECASCGDCTFDSNRPCCLGRCNRRLWQSYSQSHSYGVYNDEMDDI